eukprot:NODE_18488_length_890_cov_2.994758.p2 GENE.NODE_18488_length_890_cov_2.994758~~NODE_18488_length_890_cov_2.994758.p2  ORF type:complete len:222 (+),score=75.35 NODE_18488_length_890_cov_2.994758:66-668(+)
MRELREGEVCACFFVAESNGRTTRFWQEALTNALAVPRMGSFAPFTVQQHVNSMLCYRSGGGPQDGDFGIRWDFLPDEDCIWAEPEAGVPLATAGLHLALGGGDACELLRRVREAVRATAAPQHDDAAARRVAVEIDRITAGLARARAELAATPPVEAKLQQPALALASAELLAEVESLERLLLSGAGRPRTPESFEAVD